VLFTRFPFFHVVCYHIRCAFVCRWKETAPGHWTGVLAERVWTLTQDENAILYHIYPVVPENGTGSEDKIGCREVSTPVCVVIKDEPSYFV